ncbi:MAG: hypothetical protein QOG80_3137, partial [Pseudonocardiales bacterium]|nr:hypothetical protein [Pseudonocardiales bacterium]
GRNLIYGPAFPICEEPAEIIVHRVQSA